MRILVLKNWHGYKWRGLLSLLFLFSVESLFVISQGTRTSKDSPRQTLSSARTLQALHKNSKQTCETHQTAPLAADCTPTLKSASQNHQRTKN